jgi:hypothetical protein
LGKKRDPISKITREKRTGVMVQVQHLPSKRESLSSNPVPPGLHDLMTYIQHCIINNKGHHEQNSKCNWEKGRVYLHISRVISGQSPHWSVSESGISHMEKEAEGILNGRGNP